MPSAAEYWKNPEKHRAAADAYRLANPDWHRTSNREWARKKRARDPQPSRDAQKRYRENNPDKCVKRTVEWARSRPGQYLFYNAKYRAKKLGLPFDITLEDVVIPDVCPVLGIPINAKMKGRRGFHPNSPSLDRIVPAKGYVRGNVKVISNLANCIKRDATAEQLEKVAAYVRRETGA